MKLILLQLHGQINISIKITGPISVTMLSCTSKNTLKDYHKAPEIVALGFFW